MPFRKSIGTRVFGLAIFLLALTIALVGFLLWQVANLQRELQLLANCDIPLASSLSRLDEFGLRRRLAFEQAFNLLNANPKNEQALSEAQAGYDLFTNKLSEEFNRARGILTVNHTAEAQSAELAGFAMLLEQVEAAYLPMTARQKDVLALLRAGDVKQANMLVNSLDDMQALVQTQRAELQNGTARRTEVVASDALSRQSRITYLSISATTSTVLLGLLVAFWVTQGLVRPVRLLIGAMQDVQRGQLDMELPVSSSDEIGALTSSFNFFVREMRSKAQIKKTFGKYVDPRILDRVLDTTGSAESNGERQMMTVSFGDLVGFAGNSERLTPSSMVRMLNRHFGLQANAIQEHRGIVDKFIGDAIMSFWGPPFVAPAEHAELACRAALAQLAALEVLRTELPELTGLRREAPNIDLRIGLATGEVIVGNIGSENAQGYTVIGDTVNIASRIESANRIYGTRILVSGSVASDVASRFELREVDAIAVKGRSEPVKIFELLGPSGCLDADARTALNSYADGLQHYRAGAWEAAKAAFEHCLAQRRDDRAAQVMLERIDVLRAKPRNESWDGVWKLESK